MLQLHVFINNQLKVFYYYSTHVHPLLNETVIEQAWTTEFKYTEFHHLSPFLKMYLVDAQALETRRRKKNDA